MRRHGYILQQAADYGILNESFDYHVCGAFKKTRYGRYLVSHRDQVIEKLRKLILDGTLEPGEFVTMTIKERNKEREIQMIRMMPTIGIHAIMTVVERYIDPTLMADTAASIKGRGGVYLLKRIIKDFKRDFEHCHYIYKDDIAKFYQNIPQDEVMKMINKKFKDKKLIVILEKFIRLLSKGLSIGMRPSLGFANMYLSVYVDHVLKEMERVKYYRRYCDDRVLLAGSYHELTHHIRAMSRQTELALQTIKQSAQCFDITKRPLDFLGYVIFANGKIRIRKHIKKRFDKKWHTVKSIKRRIQLIGSFYGIAKHANAKHLFKKITNIKMATFASMGYKPKDKNGKKQFDVPTVSVNSLIGVNILIVDFEIIEHVKNFTEPRLLIVVKLLQDCEVGHNGETVKFWTGSEKLRNQMEFLVNSVYELLKQSMPNQQYPSFENITYEEKRKILDSKMKIEDCDMRTRLKKMSNNGIVFE